MGNARGINSAWFFFFFGFSPKTQLHYSACVKCKRMRRMNPRAHGLKQWLPSCTAMAITLNIYTKSHTAHTKTCRASWERAGPRTLREIDLRAILYD